MANNIFYELSPIKEGDFLYIAYRQKSHFNFPVHKHETLELNFIEGGAGAQRIVGDNVETIGDLELVLIGEPELAHGWLQGGCQSQQIHELTLQFNLDADSNPLFKMNAFHSIRKMMDDARRGIVFNTHTIMRCYSLLSSLKNYTGYFTVSKFFDLLYHLSLGEWRTLASNSFSSNDDTSDSQRIRIVKNYVDRHYAEEIRLADVAALVGMVPGAFSRYFAQHTGRLLSEYMVEARLGHAARELVDTTMSVSEIGYACGYNTLSNSNRLFKKYKGCTPSEFREKYRQTRVVI